MDHEFILPRFRENSGEGEKKKYWRERKRVLQVFLYINRVMAGESLAVYFFEYTGVAVGTLPFTCMLW